MFILGFVPLVDLLNGEYFKRKEEERKLKIIKKEKLKLKRKLLKIHQENEEIKYIIIYICIIQYFFEYNKFFNL